MTEPTCRVLPQRDDAHSAGRAAFEDLDDPKGRRPLRRGVEVGRFGIRTVVGDGVLRQFPKKLVADEVNSSPYFEPRPACGSEVNTPFPPSRVAEPEALLAGTRAPPRADDRIDSPGIAMEPAEPMTA